VRAGNEHWRRELRRQEVAWEVRCNHMKLEACGCEKEFFAKMAVDAVMALGEASHLDMIGIKKSSLDSSILQVSFEIQFWSLKLCKVLSGIVKDSVGGFLVF
jgi:hypothetical protein